MNDLGENLQTVNGPRPRATEVRGAFDRVHALGLHRPEVLPRLSHIQGGELVDGTLQTEAAGHQDQDIWVVSGDLLPRHLYGWRPLPAHLVSTTRQADHFWDPMTGGKGWVQPLHGEDSWLYRRCVSHGCDVIDTVAKGPHQRSGSFVNTGRVAHLLDGLQHSREIVGLKGQNRPLPRERDLKTMDRFGNFLIRDGTDLAQLLRENESGVQPL